MKRRLLLSLFLAFALVPASFAQQYFGQNDQGNGHGSRVANYIKLARFQNTAGTGTLTELGICLFANGGTSSRVRLAVYSDTGSTTVPGPRLLDAGEIVNPVVGWNSVTGLTLPVTDGAYYWLGWNSNAALDVYHNTAYYFLYGAFTYAPFPVNFGVGQQQAVRTSIRAKVLTAPAPRTDALAPGFSVRPSVPHVNTVVKLTDYSKGNIVSWLWDFGDGATSSEQNPRTLTRQLVRM